MPSPLTGTTKDQQFALFVTSGGHHAQDGFVVLVVPVVAVVDADCPSAPSQD